MRRHSLARTAPRSQFLTTGDVARMLERTPRGVRWLADQEHLTYQRTQSGQRLYWPDEVKRLAERRMEARLRGVRVLRPRLIGPRDGPHQLALFGPRLVRETLPHAEVHSADSGEN